MPVERMSDQTVVAQISRLEKHSEAELHDIHDVHMQ